MNDIQDKLPLFLEAIRQAAEESCRKTEEETAAYTHTRMQEAEKEMHDRHEVLYQRAIGQVKQQTDVELSAYRSASRRRLVGLRDAYEQKVFEDAARAVAAFAATPEYGMLLERSAAQLGALLPAGVTDAVVYLRPADAAFADRVQAAFGRPCRMESDEANTLGGLRMESAAASLRADDTLAARLEREKPRFREQAGLAVL